PRGPCACRSTLGPRRLHHPVPLARKQGRSRDPWSCQSKVLRPCALPSALEPPKPSASLFVSRPRKSGARAGLPGLVRGKTVAVGIASLLFLGARVPSVPSSRRSVSTNLCYQHVPGAC